MLIGAAIAVLAAWLAWHISDIRARWEATQYLWKKNGEINSYMSYAAPNDVVWDGIPDITGVNAIAAARPEMHLVRDATGDFAAAVAPPFWTLPAGVSYGRTTLFLHERRTDRGQRVLLVIEYVPYASGLNPHLAATVVVPGTLRRWPVQYGPFVIFDDRVLLRGTHKRFHAGQADLHDLTRCTLRFETTAQSGEIAALLREDHSPGVHLPFNFVVQFQPAPAATIRP